MKKIAFALALSLAASTAFAGGTAEPTMAQDQVGGETPQQVVIAGGVGTGAIIAGGLLLLLLLSSNSTTTTTN